MSAAPPGKFVFEKAQVYIRKANDGYTVKLRWALYPNLNQIHGNSFYYSISTPEGKQHKVRVYKVLRNPLSGKLEKETPIRPLGMPYLYQMRSIHCYTP